MCGRSTPCSRWAGTYTRPIELEVESLLAGRTWASDTVTATQAGKVLSRATVLLNVVDEDLMRHEPPMPSVPGPGEVDAAPGQVFPGAEIRPVSGGDEVSGVPVEMAWHRFERPLASQAANQAVLAWATCGNIIGLAMRPHRDRVRIEDAHASISTGVIAQTIHFVERFDVSQWLLVRHEATKAATGRVYGDGRVFAEGGILVAAFHQDSMAKAAAAPLDPKTSM